MEAARVLSSPVAQNLANNSTIYSVHRLNSLVAKKDRHRREEISSGEEFFSFKDSNEKRTSTSNKQQKFDFDFDSRQDQQSKLQQQSPQFKVIKQTWDEREQQQQRQADKIKKDNWRVDNRARGRSNTSQELHEQLAREIESKLSIFEQNPVQQQHYHDQQQQQQQPAAAAACKKDLLEQRQNNETGATVESEPKKRESFLDALIEGQKSWPEEKTIVVEIRNGRRISSELESDLFTSSSSRRYRSSRLEERAAKKETSSSSVIESDIDSNVLQNSRLQVDSIKEVPNKKQQVHKIHLSADKVAISKSETKETAGKEEKGTNLKSFSSKLEQEANNKLEFEEEEEKKRKILIEEKDNQTKGKRPPTFGSTPHKLTRLPYFSYFGKARNVSLISATDRNKLRGSKESEESVEERYRRKENSSVSTPGGGSSVSSSSKLSTTNSPISSAASSSSSSTSLFSKTIPIKLEKTSISKTSKTINQQAKGARASSLNRGYSNISNLFPGKPMNIRGGSGAKFAGPEGEPEFIDNRRGATRNSSSLLNLNQLSGDRKRPLSATRFVQGPNSQRNKWLDQNLNQPSPVKDFIDDYNDRGSFMRRQNSATSYANRRQPVGFYQGRNSSASLTHHRPYTSTSSLHHSAGGGGSAGMSPYGADYRNYGLVDRDCPIHGYTPPPIEGNAANLMSRSSQHLSQQAYEPDLLYDPYSAAYYDRLPRLPGGSLYSPTSPRLIPNNRGAYYNSSSRFSVFHSPDANLKSTLAPPNEQLRRILGYQPQTKPLHLHPQWAYTRPFIHLQGASAANRSPSPLDNLDSDGNLLPTPMIKPRFEPYNQLHDAQAIRAVDFHPSGEIYAIGSNSRALRICAYPAEHELRHFNHQEHVCKAPRILFKFLQVHRGSIYCVRFNSTGQLLATGSNDQTVHLVRYNSNTHSPDGDEFRLSMHDGTIRDLCFIDDTSNGSSLLLSAGGGDNKIYVTDCDTVTPFQSMAGHTQMVMSLDHWSGATFVSASYDRTIRFWDLRARNCTSIISAPPSYGTGGKWAGPGAPVCSVKMDPSGRLLASGHSDSTCMLYDIRGSRIIQAFRPHQDEIRTVCFSPKSYYLLTGGYDGRLILSDLQGDLTQPLPSCCVAESDDKIVQAKWHPSDFTFVTTGADKSATLWALPTE